MTSTEAHAPASTATARSPDAPLPGWIVHGVVRAGARRPAGAPPHSRIEVGDLLALVSPSLLDAAADPARQAAEAMRHNAILAAYARETDVAPARFGALASGPAAAAALIAAEAERHAAILDRIAGSVEMGARIVLAPETSGPPPRPALSARPDDGAGYLRGVAAARDARRRAAAEQAEAVTRLVAELTVKARDVALFPPRPAADGTQRLADAALLVSRLETAALRSRALGLAETAAAAGLAIEITGPWPAYSFAEPKPAPEPAEDSTAEPAAEPVPDAAPAAANGSGDAKAAP
ncbi:GvpL/GvpF family gas vesicle protein [Rubrimonas cliftonensis]|uniref:Gas vesicle synthesis protein GvpL/GvpF n=1 Tax=Rubrimonas cliftonensis TaxID=89524 RepID=A0A1H4AMA1_9RHOB|nr:GvpL/GvpF family gas vesicle protein [Rubrimonas cliftonensis]SEA36918.1 Gas vesicle synthesis protein GvpL/GvpF [Rubrimonas cliftonensis]